MPSSSPHTIVRPATAAGKRTLLPAISKLQLLYDLIFRGLCRGSAILVIGLMVLLFVVLCYESIPSFTQFGWRFFVDTEWDPQGRLGALPFIYGTLVTSFIGMLIAVPLGFGTA